jgi:hypothetical protein
VLWFYSGVLFAGLRVFGFGDWFAPCKGSSDNEQRQRTTATTTNNEQRQRERENREREREGPSPRRQSSSPLSMTPRSGPPQRKDLYHLSRFLSPFPPTRSSGRIDGPAPPSTSTL